MNLIGYKQVMKKIVIVIVFLLIACGIVYTYVYQSHRDIQEEEATHIVDGITMVKEFVVNQDVASEKYLNKTIVVSGEVTEIEEKAISISEAVYVAFDNVLEEKEPKIGTKVKVKGRCIGYDELLEVIKIDQAAVIE